MIDGDSAGMLASAHNNGKTAAFAPRQAAPNHSRSQRETTRCLCGQIGWTATWHLSNFAATSNHHLRKCEEELKTCETANTHLSSP
jgi:hypothetical protein